MAGPRRLRFVVGAAVVAAVSNPAAAFDDSLLRHPANLALVQRSLSEHRIRNRGSDVLQRESLQFDGESPGASVTCKPSGIASIGKEEPFVAFDIADADGDRSINLEETLQFAKSLCISGKDGEAIFTKRDADGDGKLDHKEWHEASEDGVLEYEIEEFKRARAHPKTRGHYEGNATGTRISGVTMVARNVSEFDEFDLNGDGVLEDFELGSAFVGDLAVRYPGLTTAEQEHALELFWDQTGQIMLSIDANGNGNVTRSEYDGVHSIKAAGNSTVKASLIHAVKAQKVDTVPASSLRGSGPPALPPPPALSKHDQVKVRDTVVTAVSAKLVVPTAPTAADSAVGTEDAPVEFKPMVEKGAAWDAEVQKQEDEAMAAVGGEPLPAPLPAVAIAPRKARARQAAAHKAPAHTLAPKTLAAVPVAPKEVAAHVTSANMKEDEAWKSVIDTETMREKLSEVKKAQPARAVPVVKAAAVAAVPPAVAEPVEKEDPTLYHAKVEKAWAAVEASLASN